MKETEQQLNNLLKQFVDEQTAHEMAEDFRHMDRLMASLALSDVSQKTLSEIKTRVQRCLAEQQRKIIHRRIRIWSTSAAAAVILLAAGVTFFFMTRQPSAMHLLVTASSIWDDENVSDTDPIDLLSARIEIAAGQIDPDHEQSSPWFDDDDSLAVEIQDLKTIATNTDFWKG
jgi:hypothetical protein